MPKPSSSGSVLPPANWKRVARESETKEPMKQPREMANEVTGPYLQGQGGPEDSVRAVQRTG
jgi:hypothetical protein